jgi:endo-1,4-beta-D-glucanase Y
VRRRAAAAVVALALVGAAGCGGAAVPPDTPRAAAERFLARYVGPDGRVVRHDQGGDTVSEGQAYALLIAAAIGDRARFDRVWRWTSAHLARGDGLLSWRWANGGVQDRQPAADADVDAARALLLGAERFHEPALAPPARRIARSVLAQEQTGDRLVAGPWAKAGAVLDPSYISPRAADALARTGNAAAWRAVRDQGVADARALTAGGRLPPDWAHVQGSVTATGPPSGGGQASYGFDAARLPVRMAESCSPAARRVAASLWAKLKTDSGVLPRGLDGSAGGGRKTPLGLVAAASAAGAIGDRTDRDNLLDQATALDRRAPTYYGAAWIALGRLMLQTHRLGRCP